MPGLLEKREAGGVASDCLLGQLQEYWAEMCVLQWFRGVPECSLSTNGLRNHNIYNVV